MLVMMASQATASRDRNPGVGYVMSLVEGGTNLFVCPEKRSDSICDEIKVDGRWNRKKAEIAAGVVVWKDQNRYAEAVLAARAGIFVTNGNMRQRKRNNLG